jgi:hypothetical protein
MWNASRNDSHKKLSFRYSAKSEDEKTKPKNNNSSLTFERVFGSNKESVVICKTVTVDSAERREESQTSFFSKPVLQDDAKELPHKVKESIPVKEVASLNKDKASQLAKKLVQAGSQDYNSAIATHLRKQIEQDAYAYVENDTVSIESFRQTLKPLKTYPKRTNCSTKKKNSKKPSPFREETVNTQWDTFINSSKNKRKLYNPSSPIDLDADEQGKKVKTDHVVKNKKRSIYSDIESEMDKREGKRFFKNNRNSWSKVNPSQSEKDNNKYSLFYDFSCLSPEGEKNSSGSGKKGSKNDGKARSERTRRCAMTVKSYKEPSSDESTLPKESIRNVKASEYISPDSPLTRSASRRLNTAPSTRSVDSIFNFLIYLFEMSEIPQSIMTYSYHLSYKHTHDTIPLLKMTLT